MPRLRRLRDPRLGPGLHARARAAAGADRLRRRASAARGASSTTWTPTGCTASTAARRRSPPGVATSRPDLSVWVVSGDGDALSIGGNHLIHALRRNVPIKILLFNNQIYGLTKGQYSPTSEEGKVTKSTPFGSQDHPFNPVALALGAEATFVARTVDTDKKHLAETLRAAADARGLGLRRDLPELQRLQRRRLRRRARQGPEEREPDPPRARRADPLRRRGRARRRARRRRPARARRRGRGRRGRPARPRRPPRRPEPRVRARPPGRPADRPDARSASSAPSSARSTASRAGGLELEQARAEVGTPELEELLHSGRHLDRLLALGAPELQQ